MYKSLAKLTLLVILLVSILAAISSSRVSFDYDFEKFFPLGDGDLDYFLEFRQQFENDNDFLLIGFENKEGIFRENFLSRIDSLTNYLRLLPQVDQVLSPTNISRIVYGPMGWLPIPYLHLSEPHRLVEDSINIYEQQDLVGQLFSSDGKAICMLVKHRQRIKRAGADSLMNGLKHQLKALGLPPPHLAGKTLAQPVYLDLIQQEMTIFMVASLVLIVLFLAITYRALWAILVPLLVVTLAGTWTLGFMTLVGKPLDLMMVLLPTIIFVVGMSDVVHILTRYIEELRLGHSRVAALTTTFKEVGIATFLTSLTTGIGFLTLMISNIGPIRDFGLFTAIGVFIAYVLAFTLMPSILIFLPRPKIVENIQVKKQWRRLLSKSMTWTLRNSKTVLYGSIMLLILAVLGILKLEVNTFLIDDLPRSHPLKADFMFFDEHFGGSRPFEMAIHVGSHDFTVFDYPVLKEMEKVENYLMQYYGTSALTSPVKIIKTTNQAVNGGSKRFHEIPDSLELDKLGRFTKQIQRLPYFSNMVSEDQKSSRFTGRIGDIGSNITTARTAALRSFINSSIDTSMVNFRVTGTSLLIDKSNGYLVNNMLAGLAIAFGVVALIAGLMFRSWRMILITLVPNVIPLLMVAGIMGALDITLKLSTSVIFTVAFGIAVDDTIHFISKFKMELAKGKSKLYAIKRTYFSTGKAIIITTLILISGFLTLLMSSFGGTYYIGLFVGLTLVFALIIDLTLLPTLILLFYKPRGSRGTGEQLNN
jgi:predicted RND superfamily exporter protein